MTEYYKPHKHVNWIFNPKQANNFKLSRSKIDLFLNCPRCFYIDNRLGTARPPGYPFALNSAVDCLLKKEFDIHRAKGEKHPLIEKYGVDARPVAHESLDIWRENFKGVQYLEPKTGLLITGAIDDLWITLPPHPTSPRAGEEFEPEYIVVDYKSTSKDEEINELNKDWQDGYKRQMEIYQWLLRKNGLKVSDTGYFVYCNGCTDREAFDGKLEFEVTLIPYKGNDDWVEKTIIAAHECLCSDSIPAASPDCDYCNYIEAVQDITKK